jgi:hypothetical protein
MSVAAAHAGSSPNGLAARTVFALVGEAGTFCINDRVSTDVVLGVRILRSGLVDRSFAQRGRVIVRGLSGGWSSLTAVAGERYVLAGITGPQPAAHPRLHVMVLPRAALEAWVGQALAHVATLPPKRPR